MKRLISVVLATLLCVPVWAELQVDEHGLILSPAEGDEVVYQRQGAIGVPVGFDISQGTQEGEVHVVYCSDGTVYLQHPLSISLERSGFKIVDTWIKGTQQGDLITFPAQPVSYSSAFHCTISVSMGNYQLSAAGIPSTVPCRDEQIVFKSFNDGKRLELQNSSSEHVLCAYYDVDDDACYYWEYLTVLRSQQGLSQEGIVPPADAVQQEFVLSGYDHGTVNYMARLAWSGDDVYLGSFSWYAEGAWIKGRREGNQLLFEPDQFLKHYNDQGLYFYAAPFENEDHPAETLVLTYNEATGGYTTSGQDIYIASDAMSRPYDYMEQICLARLFPVADVSPEVVGRMPAGTLRTYQREGLSVGYYNTHYWASQEGLPLQVVTTADSTTLYMQNPISQADNGNWVKGYLKADGRVHVPLMQWVQQDAQYGSLRTALVRREEVDGGFIYDLVPSAQEVTFSIDADGVWTLDPLAADEDPTADPPIYLYGLVESRSLTWIGFGDCESRYVPTGEEEQVEDEPIDISQPEEGEVINEWGIIVQPGVGEEQTYQRHGKGFRADGMNVVEVDQDGVLHLVLCPSGTVYMQQPVSSYTSAYAATSWIKGKRIGTRLCFPASQPVNYSQYYDATLSVCLTRSYDSVNQTFWPDRSANIEFEVSQDGQTLTLLGTEYSSPLAIFYDDDDNWNGFGDYATVLNFEGEGRGEETVAPDPELPVEYYLLYANDVEEGPKVYNAKLVRDGTTVYLGSFCFYADDLWIKGYADGADLVFPREQYLQSMYGYDLFCYGAAESHGGFTPCDFRLSWDEAVGGYLTDQHLFVTWGKITSSINRAEELRDIRMMPDENDGAPYILRGVPEGTLRIYNRTGGTFGYEEGQIYMYRQEDVRDAQMELMYDRDGRTVYMHNPISSGVPVGGAWVQGYRDSDERLHFPLLQWIDYSEDFGYGFRTALLVRTQGTEYVMVVNIHEVTFSLDPLTGIISLDRLEGVDYDSEIPNILYGLVYSDDYNWGGYGDFDTVYYPDFEWTGQGIEIVQADSNKAGTWYDLQGRRVAAPVAGQVYLRGKSY